MLRKEQLVSGRSSTVEAIEDIWAAVRSVEEGQPSGTRMELELRFEGRSGSNITQVIAEKLSSPVNTALRAAGVHTWPEHQDIVLQSGNTVRVRWYKNPLWASVIWPVLRTALIALLVIGVIVVVIWAVNRYFPEAKTIPLAIIGGIALLFFLPSIMQIFGEKRMEYYG